MHSRRPHPWYQPSSMYPAKYLHKRPRWLTFTWWGCYGSCLWHKPTELARSFKKKIILFLCLFLYLWPFQLYFIQWILQTTLRLLTVFFVSSFCLIGPFNYISLSESLPQPWYNPLWLTGLKAPTNKLTSINWDHKCYIVNYHNDDVCLDM